MKIKLQAKGIRKTGTLVLRDERLYFHFGYWPALNAEIKNMEGRKYHGYDEIPVKCWSVPITQHNLFQLEYLKGNNPYNLYDAVPPAIDFKRKLYNHQRILASHILHVHYGYWAAEMGLGKTLAAIEAFEHVDPTLNQSNFWWVGTKSSLRAVQYEFIKWNSSLKPRFLTYEGVVKLVKEKNISKAPRVIVFDEASKIKTPAAQRSQACQIMADGVRSDWGDSGYVVAMSGSPAPKSPLDWWMGCHIVRPGFLVEGNINLFKQRLAVLSERENLETGGKYNEIVRWRDSDDFCNQCGEPEEHPVHSVLGHENNHRFVKSINEVAKLYSRLKGLVVVQFKRDCLELPEKRYVVETVTPSPETLRAYNLIVRTAGTAIRALTLARELSDGFAYQEVSDGFSECPLCKGTGECVAVFDSETGNRVLESPEYTTKTEEHNITCDQCSGSGEVPKVVRTTEYVSCPKDAVIETYLDNHEEVGRLVIYSGFTASIDKLTALCQKKEWHTITVDGRGWFFRDRFGVQIADNPLVAFQDMKDKYPKVVFIGHQGSAGLGLTLTASPTIVYYSNDFNFESRYQSEDRIHRPGLDLNRGATIVDILHLPTDQLVLDNLKKKRRLQSISLGEIVNAS